ncbi:MAG: bifunctional 2-polyprenyl-6-hydroxyphenol methylase/3-demethylubiquinol 3-O-methyltransferase UbiG [Myxococcota bacterium]
MKIDNEMYFREDLVWWDESLDSHTTLLRHFINPVRFAFFKRILGGGPGAKLGGDVLDVGCGGGFLSEEFARAGFNVTGLDPSPHLLKEAGTHAARGGLQIDYRQGYGEQIPFPDGSFDYVACCDVLEHVNDLGRVIGEISRVLKPGGTFFFDTINRTLSSWLLVIKIAQDWRFTAWEAPRSHEWSKFVTPAELAALMSIHGMACRELRGIGPGRRWSNFLEIRRRAKGEISLYEMAARLGFHECDDLGCSYMGYAVKQP